MAYVFQNANLGLPPITSTIISTQTSAPKPWKLGDIQRAVDPTYGGAEFIYLIGAANTVAGLCVAYGPSTYQTTLLPNTANLGQPVAVAMSANLAGYYGWYQISGVATVLKTNVSYEPNKAVFISGTTGRVMDTVASGKQIENARSANVATVTTTTSTILVSLNRPHAQGQNI
jgi:hypothetical protein